MRLRALVVLTLVLAAGCSRCGRGPAAQRELLQLVPKNAEAILVVPDVARLGERLKTIESLKVAGFLSQLQGFSSGTQLVDQVMAQVGVDLRSRETLEKAGFDPGRGMALILLPQDQAYSVIAVKDAGKFREMLTRLARDRLGAGETATRKEDGLEVTTFLRGGSAVAGMVALEDFVLVGAGPSVVASLAGRARLAEGARLSDDASFAAGSGRLPRERDFTAYLPAGSARARAFNAAGAVATGQLGQEAIRLFLDLPWPNTRAPLQALVKQDAPSPYGALPADTFLVARFAGDAEALETIWPHLVGVRRADSLREAGFDVKAQVLSNVQPGAVLGLSLAPTMSFTGGVNVDVRRTNPLRYAHVVAVAEVKDPAKAEQMLQALPAIAPRIGAQIEPAERDGKEVFLTRYSQGEGLHLGLSGSRLVAAGPEPRLLEALAKPAEAGALPPPLVEAPWREALEKEAFGVVVDLRQLAESVRALPSSAWGVGGFAIKATTLRWLEAMSDLRAVTGSVATRDGALQAELTLRISRE